MANKVKVVGYAQKVFYNDGIQYRNFSPDLVGQQRIASKNDSILTNSNFVVTTNLESKANRFFRTNEFSKFYTLEDTGEDSEFVNTFFDKDKLKLNLDKSKLTNYSYFGSLREYIRVTLEDIITQWPASIFVKSNINAVTGFTIENKSYNTLEDTTTFTSNVSHFDNKYDIKFLASSVALSGFSSTNDPRNLSINYQSYVVSGTTGEFPIMGFTGSTNDTNSDTRFIVKGNPFSAYTTTSIALDYHIRPKNDHIEEFFKLLSDLGDNLLNRRVYPKYTSEYTFPVETEGGNVIYSSRALTWPTTDGYNLDFNTTEYITFVSTLLNIADSFDTIETDLIVRFLTAQSITDFDTISINADSDVEASQKISKTLRIYGREFDELKKYIDGIKFANRTTYDKKDNTPDLTIKNLAHVLGWEIAGSIGTDSIVNDLVKPYSTPLSGETVGLTAFEAEVELWRRLVLNTPWLWKSKGTRKSVEFLLDFMGIPEDLVRFNEYVYVADEALNMAIFNKLLTKLTGSQSKDGITVDDDGYPKTLPNSPDMWFQKAGMWYRETGGDGAVVTINSGNNPHAGPYDWGSEYIRQFSTCTIDNFSATTINFDTITTDKTNLFTNYSAGTMNTLQTSLDMFCGTTETYAGSSTTQVDTSGIKAINSLDGSDVSICVKTQEWFMEDPMPVSEKTDCGCTSLEDDHILKIDINKTGYETTCVFDEIQFNPTNYITVVYNGQPTDIISMECCYKINGLPEYYNSTGGVASYKCKWQ